LGGLHGLSLDFLDTKKNRNFYLHAPFNVESRVNGSIPKRILMDLQFKFNQHDHTSSIFKDDNLSIKTIEMLNDSTSDQMTKTYSYLIELDKTRPKFNKEKFDQDFAELKYGSWIKELINGVDHTLEDGRVVKASDYLDYSNPNSRNERKIIFLDIPSLDNEKNREILFNSRDLNQESVILIVHMSNASVLNDSSYLEWIKNFKNNNCIHVFLDETFPTIDLPDVYDMQARLNLIDSKVFPLLPSQTSALNEWMESGQQREKRLQTEQKLKVVFGRPKMKFTLDYKLSLDTSDCLTSFDNKKCQKAVFDQYETDAKLAIEGTVK
jgi:hypothetical protein